jgi:hypothetical protein
MTIITFAALVLVCGDAVLYRADSPSRDQAIPQGEIAEIRWHPIETSAEDLARLIVEAVLPALRRFTPA